MSNVVSFFRRRVRSLKKRYDPAAPFGVERVDHDDGSISYEIMDWRPDSYRIVAFVHEDDDGEDRGQALTDANLIVRALNFMHSYKPT